MKSKGVNHSDKVNENTKQGCIEHEFVLHDQLRPMRLLKYSLKKRVW